MGQRRVIAQFDLIVTSNAVGFADRRHDLRLLHRIDAEIGFEIEVQIEHVDGIAGLLGYQRQDSVFHGLVRPRRFGLRDRRSTATT